MKIPIFDFCRKGKAKKKKKREKDAKIELK